MCKKIIIFLFISFLFSMPIWAVASPEKLQLIYDTDAANDDIIALVYLMTHPKIDLKAITVEGTGEAHGYKGARNMADVYYFLKGKSIPIAYGNPNSLEGFGHPFPDYLRELMDNVLVGRNIPHHPAPLIGKKTTSLIRGIILANKKKITILATGPLTNIAEFIQTYPQLVHRINKIIIMGGAVNVKGNIRAIETTSTNEVAEWNIYADPKAAEIVLKSGVPILLVPLNATNDVPMTSEFYANLSTQSQPSLKLVYELMKVIVDNLGMDIFIHEFYLWDALAAMITVDESIAIIQQLPISIDLQTAQTKLVDPKDPSARMINVAMGINHPQNILLQLVKDIVESSVN